MDFPSVIYCNCKWKLEALVVLLWQAKIYRKNLCLCSSSEFCLKQSVEFCWACSQKFSPFCGIDEQPDMCGLIVPVEFFWVNIVPVELIRWLSKFFFLLCNVVNSFYFYFILLLYWIIYLSTGCQNLFSRQGRIIVSNKILCVSPSPLLVLVSPLKANDFKMFEFNDIWIIALYIYSSDKYNSNWGFFLLLNKINLFCLLTANCGLMW